jgi:hypothetical protein
MARRDGAPVAAPLNSQQQKKLKKKLVIFCCCEFSVLVKVRRDA